MYAWFVGENIANVIQNEATTFSGTPADPQQYSYIWVIHWAGDDYRSRSK